MTWFCNEIVKVTDRELLISNTLIQNLYFELKRVDANFDSCILVTGREGTAKTTLSCALSYFMGYDYEKKKSNFSLDWIVFTLDQIEEAVNKAEIGQTILIDEFVLTALATDALTSMQKRLVKMFVLNRYKRLKYILVIPYIWMLGSYFATDRTSCMIHCYSPNNLDRGYFKFYSYPNKAHLYNTGKKIHTYKQSPPDFEGRFLVTSIADVGIDETAYNKKKREALDSVMNDDIVDRWLYATYKLSQWVLNKYPENKLIDMVRDSKMGVHPATLKAVFARMKDKLIDKEFKQQEKEQAINPQKLVLPFNLPQQQTKLNYGDEL